MKEESFILKNAEAEVQENESELQKETSPSAEGAEESILTTGEVCVSGTQEQFGDAIRGSGLSTEIIEKIDMAEGISLENTQNEASLEAAAAVACNEISELQSKEAMKQTAPEQERQFKKDDWEILIKLTKLPLEEAFNFGFEERHALIQEFMDFQKNSDTDPLSIVLMEKEVYEMSRAITDILERRRKKEMSMVEFKPEEANILEETKNLRRGDSEDEKKFDRYHGQIIDRAIDLESRFENAKTDEERNDIAKAIGRCNMIIQEIDERRPMREKEDSARSDFISLNSMGRHFAEDIKKNYSEELSPVGLARLDRILENASFNSELYKRERFIEDLTSMMNLYKSVGQPERVAAWIDVLQPEIARYKESAEKNIKRESFPMGDGSNILIEISGDDSGDLDKQPAIGIKIKNKEGKEIDLSEFGKRGMIFTTYPGEAHKDRDLAASQIQNLVFIPLKDPKFRENLPKRIFSILHELGHTHQSQFALDNPDFFKMKVGMEKRSLDFEKKLARQERNAWARAIVYARELRRAYDVDVFAPFSSQKEALKDMKYALGTYEKGSVETLGEEFRGLFSHGRIINKEAGEKR